MMFKTKIKEPSEGPIVEFKINNISLKRQYYYGPGYMGYWTKLYRYWCSCGTPLTDGPTGGVAVNAVCEKCKVNYGNLEGYNGTF